MKTRALVPLLATIAFAALLLPGVAPARTRPASRHTPTPKAPTPPEVSAQFSLPATNGFEVTASVDHRRQLTLTALKWGNVIQSASYSLALRPRRGSDEIVANLGKLGRIDVRFVPQKLHYEKPPKDCHGPRIVIEQGHFVGAVAFHGEDGFTEARAHRAAGAITRVPSFECPPAGPPPNLKKIRRELEALEKAAKAEKAEMEEKKEESLAVRLHATARGGRVSLTATKFVLKEKHGEGLSLNNLIVTGIRQRGRIKEESAAAELFGKGSTLVVPNRKNPASEGILKPPAPFSGSATFRRHPKKPPSWTGDLRIDLLGFGQVRLTGPGTHASMCEGTACLLRDIPSERGLIDRLGWE
jgi:hypothetical protein